MTSTSDRVIRWQRYWDKKSRNHDKEMQFWDRRLFGNSRTWACSRARGNTLEVAVGTALNLPFYPDDVAVTGIDISEHMLAIGRDRAARLGHPATLQLGDAHALKFEDDSFDTVVCTFGLCAIPDSDTAIAEMRRVLRPAGQLILVDHVASTSRLARGVQRALEIFTVPTAGNTFCVARSTP